MTEPTKAAPKKAAAKVQQESPLSFAERAAMANAPAWRPNVGDTFHGKLLGVRIGKTEEYGQYPVLVMRDVETDAFFAVHAFHTVLLDRLNEIKPQAGDILQGIYNGEVVTNATKDKAEKDQTSYHSYYIERDGDEDATFGEGYVFGG